MEKFIQKYIKKDKAKILHKLRISARKELSVLEKEGFSDINIKNLLKKSSKLRDSDVLMKICKNKKIKKYLQKEHKKLRDEFIEFLKHFSYKKENLPKKDDISIYECKKTLNKKFLNKDDRYLHKIRLKVKKCRYTNYEFEKFLKLIQDNLGKAHDYYNCEKLLQKFNKNSKKITSNKMKYIKKAEKARKRFIELVH